MIGLGRCGVYIHNGILLSHKKELEPLILSEVSQKEKDKYHMIAIVCGI